jgi:hypothetical protein
MDAQTEIRSTPGEQPPGSSRGDCLHDKISCGVSRLLVDSSNVVSEEFEASILWDDSFELSVDGEYPPR